LELADKDGIPKVAQDLGLAESMLYSWRAKRRQAGQPFEDQKLQQAEITQWGLTSLIFESRHCTPTIPDTNDPNTLGYNARCN
jgi:hypothetical protein